MAKYRLIPKEVEAIQVCDIDLNDLPKWLALAALKGEIRLFESIKQDDNTTLNTFIFYGNSRRSDVKSTATDYFFWSEETGIQLMSEEEFCKTYKYYY